MPAVVCPKCSAKLRVPESAAGRAAKCVKCGTRVPIPGQPEPVQAEPPAPSFDFGAPAEPGAPPPIRRKPRSSVGLVVGLVAAAVLLALGVGAYLVHQTMGRGVIIVVPPQRDTQPEEDPWAGLPKPDMTLAAWDVQRPRSAIVRAALQFQDRGEDGYYVHAQNVAGEPFAYLKPIFMAKGNKMTGHLYGILKDGDRHNFVVRLVDDGTAGVRIESADDPGK